MCFVNEEVDFSFPKYCPSKNNSCELQKPKMYFSG